MTPVEKDHSKGLNGALAAEVRAEIAAQGLTNVEVARRMDMNRETFQRYVNMKRGIDTAIVDAIGEALAVDPAELMGRAVRRLEREKATNVVAFPSTPKPPTIETAHDGAQAAYVPKEQHESVEDDGDHAE